MSDKLKATIKYLIDIKKVKDMTPKKLQKMLYYCYAWHLTLSAENSEEDELINNRLFTENFEAWVHGPVIEKVYQKYKNNGSQVISDSLMTNIDVENLLNEDEKDTINQVIEVYGEYNGNQLEAITHEETPWKFAREGLLPLDSSRNVIKLQDIYNCYAQRL